MSSPVYTAVGRLYTRDLQRTRQRRWVLRSWRDTVLRAFSTSARDTTGTASMIGKGGLYRVEPLDDYASEKEALGLGTIRVYKIDWREL
jgi:hypothetical protein